MTKRVPIHTVGIGICCQDDGEPGDVTHEVCEHLSEGPLANDDGFAMDGKLLKLLEELTKPNVVA